jgi:predicted DNA-binding transcriptional regulator AlpA
MVEEQEGSVLMEEPAQWITVPEAARRAHVPSRTVYHWIEAGTWPVRVVKYSEKRLQVRLDEFEVWLAARQAERA